MFEIRDRSGDGDGWTGVEAETLDAAKYAAVVISDEGYELPLDVVPEGTDLVVTTLVDFDESHRPIWQSSSLAAKYRSAA